MRCPASAPFVCARTLCTLPALRGDTPPSPGRTYMLRGGRRAFDPADPLPLPRENGDGFDEYITTPLLEVLPGCARCADVLAETLRTAERGVVLA